MSNGFITDGPMISSMNRSRVLVYGAVAVIVGVALVSGPAVGLADLTTPRYDTVTLGAGNASVDRVETPESARLDRGFQSSSYYLKVPDAEVRFASISGKPLVAYKLSVPSLNYTRATTTFLSSGDEGRVVLSLERDTLAGDAVTRERYDGELTVVLRYDDTETALARESIPVEVTS